MKVTVADYGVGNIHSITKALELAGARTEVATDMSQLADSDCLVLPGVGAFDAVMGNLEPVKEEILARLNDGLPALTVCIGSHVLFGGSDEGASEGVGFYGGRVRRLGSRTVPHMGWNTVSADDRIMDGIGAGDFYFAHSYYCDAPPECVRGTTEYEGFVFPTLLRKANVVSCQFHPEKSSSSGMAFLRNFVRYAEGCL